MKQEYLPDIGSVGLFNLKAPYDVLIKQNVSYTCKSIRTLSECIADGLDPFSYYYESMGLTQTDYDLDVKNEVSIVSLQTLDGEWLYIPSNYILKYPDMNGIVYRAIMLGISLGALPDTMMLDALKTSITNLVYDTIGVTSIVKEIVISSPSILSRLDHETIETARIAKTSINMSDTIKLNKTLQDLDSARAKIVELENYIKTKLNI